MIGQGDMLMMAGAKPAARESGPRETGSATRAESSTRAEARSPSEDDGAFAAALDAEDAPASGDAKPAAEAAPGAAAAAPDAASSPVKAPETATALRVATAPDGVEATAPAITPQPQQAAVDGHAPKATGTDLPLSLPEGESVAPIKAGQAEARPLQDAKAVATASEPKLAAPEAADAAPAPRAVAEAAPAPAKNPAPAPVAAQAPAAPPQPAAQEGDVIATMLPADAAPEAAPEAAPAPRQAPEAPKAAAIPVAAAQAAGPKQAEAAVAQPPFAASVEAASRRSEEDPAPRRAVDAAPERAGPEAPRGPVASVTGAGSERPSVATDFAGSPSDLDFVASTQETRASLRAEAAVAAVSLTPGAGAERVAAQVVSHIAAAADGGGERLELRLDPPELGRVRLSFTMTDAGVTAVVSADRPDVLDFLRRHGDLLERELMAAGYRDVSLDFGQGGGGQGGSAERESEEPPAPVKRLGETGPARWLSRVPGEDRLDIRI